MGLQLKELNKVMAVLENDKLIRIHRQNELKEGAQRAVGRQYFYIDYQHFCNVVKWRVAEMRRRIDSTLRNELDNKGYICPQCGKSFSPLEADKLIDFAAGTFNCDVCHAELVDNENAESVRGSQDRMQRFNRQMRFIREGLRKTENMVLPAFDVSAWIKTNIVDVERAKAALKNGDTSGLKIAGSSGTGAQGESIGIVISVDKDEATRKLERDKEAAAKRAQNVLPAWHLKSTISGDLTALGIREEEQASGSIPGAESLPSSNDAILRGLGKPGASSSAGAGSSMSMPSISTPGIDVKPDVTSIQDADYYDQYYASLAASAAPSASATPAQPDLGSDFGGEEEDVKPNVQYLDSLNEYRKRSRSVDDVGSGGGPSKLLKVNGDTISTADPVTNGFGEAYVNGMGGGEDAGAGSGAPADDPIVYVNGKPVAFSQVTEEDQELMTPEEYTAYYEVMTAQAG
ncbi:hypothetical protein K474DRAFT_1669448 [Panus rudis PR-1116 ss-1]|nr:hypothetical protein K474DRAFT_1669448 [Panus rudis PR-1116 ss-1]